MLSFKNYVSGRPTINESAKIVAGLMLRGMDPEKFILDFAEENCPFIYSEVVHSLYVEAETPADASPDMPGATPAAAGGTDPRISKATGQFNQMMGGFKQASDEMGISGLLSKIGSWFSGGGAQKNFEKAMTALGKVKNVFDTIKVPDQLAEDERFKNYKEFSDELTAAVQTLSKLNEKGKDGQTLAGLMDQLKKDPSVFTVDPAAAEKVKGDTEIVPPTPAGGGMDMDAMAAHGTGVKPEAIKKYKAEFDAGRFTTFDTAKQAEAQKEYEAIKAMPDDAKKDVAVANFMKEFGSPGLKEFRRGRRAITESVFGEALVLAGVPRRKN